MSDPGTINRFYFKELQHLDPVGRPCEVCEEHMHEHIWADLDSHGAAVDCSIKEHGQVGKVSGR